MDLQEFKDIVKAISRTKNVDFINNPYKEFTLSIPDGGIETIFYEFNFFRILSISTTTNVTIRYGSSGTPSDVVGAGIGYEMGAIVDRVQIQNNSGGVLTITVALAVGKISDDRLNISGAINISKASSFTSVADLAIVAGAAAVVIQAANSATREVIITNTGANDCRVGDAGTAVAEGTLLAVGQTIILDTAAVIYAFSTGGCTLSRSFTGD